MLPISTQSTVLNSPTTSCFSGRKAGRIPAHFHESDDPARLVPHVFKPEDYMVVVTGDPLRTNAYVFSQNGRLGFPTAKKIVLPKNYDELIAQSSRAALATT